MNSYTRPSFFAALTTVTVVLLFLPAIAFSTTPTAVSVTPSAGNGTVQSFALAYSDPAGVSDLSWVFALFTRNGSSSNACPVYYHPAWNLIYLGDDNNAHALERPGAVGLPGHLSNSQCTIDVGASSTSVAGNTLTLNLVVTFHVTGTFNGATSVYMYAQDKENNSSSFLKRGSWTVDANAVPTTVSVSPSTASGPSQMFAITVYDGNGAADVGWFYVDFFPTVGGASWNTCFIRFYPNDNHIVTWDPYHTYSAVLGQHVILNTLFCSIDVGASYVTKTLNTLTLNVSMGFSSDYPGEKAIGVYTTDNENHSIQIQQWMGKFTAQFPSLYAVSATPGIIGSGPHHSNQRTFTATFSDTNGGSGIDFAYVLFTPDKESTNPGTNACPVYLHMPSELVYLANDANTAAYGPLLLGSPGTLSNTQCTVDVGKTSVTVGPTTLRVDLPVTFASTFNGPLKIVTYASDLSGLNTGYQNSNTYTVSAPVAPNYVLASQGAVVGPTLYTRFADANGYRDMKTLYFLVGTWLNTAASCQVRYEMADNTIYLSDDAGGWKGPGQPGVPGLLSNNECTIDTGNSHSAASNSSDPTSWDFTVPITQFAAPKGRFQDVFMNAVDKEGNSAGWVYMGTWTAP
ncbi:MAG TPA: hypothetical protein VKB38_03480 [Terracidiphilus sp.]|nr:hypothetical protein [Terracidiphilus sp.]